MANKILTVFIGRFQPFHCGHAEVLSTALESSDLVLVLVGSAFIARTIKDPFSFEERANMITRWKSTQNLDTPITIRPLRDQRYNNAKWIQSVQEAVNYTISERGWKAKNVEVHLAGADRDKTTWYLSAFPQFKLALRPATPPGSLLNATQLRHRLFSNVDFGMAGAWNDVPLTTFRFLSDFVQNDAYWTLKYEYEFIEKYKSAWKAAPYEPVFVTADAAVIQSGHVLVVKRGALPGKGLWALPGGFVKSSQTVEQAAIAEVIEETGIRLAEGKKSREITEAILTGSISAEKRFDLPDRSLRGRTVTTAFLIRLDDTRPLPFVKGQFAPLEDTNGEEGVVETADAFWLPINIARSQSENWFEDHLDIVDWAVSMCD